MGGKHYIFADESGWDKDNRYGSLAKVSGTYEDTKKLNQRLKEILSDFKSSEAKFKGVNGHSSKMLALNFIKESISCLTSSEIKIHVLVWDKQDSRHQVKNRCDVENLKRMYHHNLRLVKSNWGIETDWSFYPDEFTQIDWQNDVVRFLQDSSLQRNKNPEQLTFFEDIKDIRIKYNNVLELQSDKYPIVQLADLYAGIVRTSRSESSVFNHWLSQKSREALPSLFEFDEPKLEISKSKIYKFELMQEFQNECKAKRLGVNFSESKYFKTFNHKNNIVLWHYEPQGVYDKAPIKNNFNG